jgi:tRNA 2-thiouridine synthesizing protein E
MSEDTPAFDHEGFLQDHRTWQPGVAKRIAGAEQIELGDAHWQALHAARAYYARYERSPEMRPFISYLRREGNEALASSMALMVLFPNETVRLISKIAGLPKPTSCL